MATIEKLKITSEAQALKMVRSNPNCFEKIPVKFMTKKVCEEAFKLAPWERTYAYIPEKHRTFRMFFRAMPSHGKEVREFAECQLEERWGVSVSAVTALKKKGTLPHFKKNAPQDVIDVCYIKAFNEDASVIRTMPKHLIIRILKNPLNVSKVVRHTTYTGSFSRSSRWTGSELIKLIPEQFITGSVIEDIQDELKDAAERGNSGYFLDVDEKYVTEELYLTLLEKSPTSLESIPEFRITEDMCDVAVKKDGRALKYVPEQWKSKFYIDVVKSGKGLDTIPEEDRTDRLCTLAVEQNAEQFEYIPQDKKSYALSLAAVDKDAQMIEFVPTELIDEEIMIRLIVSIFRNNYEYDFSLTGLIDYRKERGQTEPVLTMVFNSFFGDITGHNRTKALRELMHEVIKREAKLYFALLNYSGEDEDNRKNVHRFHEYFQAVPQFEHAVTAARTDIEVVSGFKQDVQARVWRAFLENNK
jgi:hypothetical protein